MFPDLEYVLRKRYLLNVVVRCGALVLFVLGAIPFVQFVGQIVLITLYTQLTGRVYRGGGGWDWGDMLVVGLPEMLKFAVPGLLLIWLGPRIVRWLTPIPKPRCPECGYWIRKGASPKCPECGAPLPHALVERGEETT